jgi:hypothetical protein
MSAVESRLYSEYTDCMNFKQNLVYFWPYTAVLAVLPVAAIDQIFWNGAIKNIDITKIMPFIILFNLPHIILSFYPLFRKEVFNEVRDKTLYGIAGILLITYLGVMYAPQLLFVFIIIATAYHVARQQIGITLLSLSTAAHKDMWKWVWGFVILESVSYLVALKSIPAAISLHIFLVLIFSLYTYRFSKDGAFTKEDRLKILGTTSTLVLTLPFLVFGYVGIVFFMKRAFHDLSSFTIYTLRDLHLDGLTLSWKNLLKVSIYPISAVLLCVLFLNQYYTSSLALLSLLALSHYYLESYLWKRGTISTRAFKSVVRSIK